MNPLREKRIHIILVAAIIFLAIAAFSRPSRDEQTLAVRLTPRIFKSLFASTPVVLSPPQAAAITLKEAASSDPSLRSPLEQRKSTGKPATRVPGVSSDPNAFRVLYGYRGPYYRWEITGEKVVVLPQTLYQWPTADWKVSGLIRNDTAAHVEVTAVSARLLDAQSKEIGRVLAWLPLTRLRPGEPAPFVITTSVPASSVSSIEWQIEHTLSRPSMRHFEIKPYWQVPFSEQRARHTRYPFDDPAEPPYPYVVFGSLHNASNDFIYEARLLGAWLEEGRVIYVDWFSFILADDRSRRDHVNLAPADFEDYIYVNADPTIGPRLSKASLAMWGLSR